MIPNPEALIGMRFVCDLRVVAITPGHPADGTRVVTVHMYGDRYELSLDEFSSLVEAGLLTEMPEGGTR